MPSSKRLLLTILGLGCAVVCAGQDRSVSVPKGNILSVQVERDMPMKVGEAVRARTVYPLYVNNKLAVPAGAELEGKIVALEAASRKARREAKLGGDFTPLHSPRIQFNRIVESDGTESAIRALPAAGGVEVVRFQSLTAGQRQSLKKKLWAEALGREKEAMRTFTAPGKKDRARRMLYSELPYHPELLNAGTQFAVELAEPVEVRTLNTPFSPKTDEDGPPTSEGKDGAPVSLRSNINGDVTLVA